MNLIYQGKKEKRYQFLCKDSIVPKRDSEYILNQSAFAEPSPSLQMLLPFTELAYFKKKGFWKCCKELF
jgi:hypothetical protein